MPATPAATPKPSLLHLELAAAERDAAFYRRNGQPGKAGLAESDARIYRAAIAAGGAA